MANSFPELGFHTKASELASVLKQEIQGRNVIVTGTSPGSLGLHAAHVIAANGAGLVVLVARNSKKLYDAAISIRSESPETKVKTLAVDFLDFDSVRTGAKELIDSGESFHVIINSAAVMAVPYQKTPEGAETHLKTNHLSHFLLTGLLLQSKTLVPFSPSHPLRIINISASSHRTAPFRFDDLTFEEGTNYNPLFGYGRSKTANILYTTELVTRAKGKNIVAYSVLPGVIKTNLNMKFGDHLTLEHLKEAGFHAPLTNDNQLDWSRVPSKTLDEGASGYILAAFSPALFSEPGAYLQDCQVTPAAEHATNPETAKKLWKLSEDLVGQQIEF